MSVHETLLQGVRSWLKFACSLTDEQVLANDFNAARVSLPYMEVRIDASDESIGVDEALHDLDESDGLQVRVRGQRRARVTLRGFGDEALDWMALAGASLMNPITLAYLDALGLSLRAIGPAIKTSPLVDTVRESQINRDFELLYAIETEPQAVASLDRVEVDMTHQSHPSPDLNSIIT